MNNQEHGRCVCDHAYEFTPSFFSMQTARLVLLVLFVLIGIMCCALGAAPLALVAGFIAGHISRAYVCDKNHSITA